jgi:hypothetical protein
MSLINDALKRAKQAQTHTPPVGISAPQLRPVEAGVRERPSRGLMLPISIVAIIVIASIFALTRFREGGQKLSANKPADMPRPIEVPKQPEPAATVNSSPPATTSKEAPEQVTFGPPSGSTSSKSENKLPAVDSLSVSVPTVPAGPAPLKLTGILFHPTHPAAMIAGKTLYLNDKLGEWQLVAINRESATLAHAGQTNVLTLPQ